jgi:4-amino-4-deoxy-L-arabinose transferase-like glycosyltransferase
VFHVKHAQRRTTSCRMPLIDLELSAMPAPSADISRRREWSLILVATGLGAVLRLWSLGQLGLVHFDEGIYALAGLWSLMPGGLTAIDPSVIPYAPPGFPILVGLAYSVLGPSDIAAILVSIVCGTLTIPVVGWLGRRTFGPGAGAAASAFAALSGMHVAFSRMALTDSAFLLVWLIGIGQGQRFLERPNFARALALGLTVGFAQNVKYNGWLVGAIVALAALRSMVQHSTRHRQDSAIRVVGWGTVAAVIAGLIYLPWLLFVERHGSYAALLAHHRSYMTGLASWPRNWVVQLAQVRALSGEPPIWDGSAWLLACIGAALSLSRTLPRLPSRDGRTLVLYLGSLATSPLLYTAFVLLAWPTLPWYLALGFSLAGLVTEPPRTHVAGTSAFRLVALSFVVMAALTPLYHPYARLWLPSLALGWLFLGGFVRFGFLEFPEGSPERKMSARGWSGIVALSALVLASMGWEAWNLRGHMLQDPLIGLFARSDSVRQACGDFARDVRSPSSEFRLLVRPPVTFYLAGKVPARTEANLEALLESRDRAAWAVVDGVQLEQEGGLANAQARLLTRWELVSEWPTTLNLPTLLDIHPEAAWARSPQLTYPLMLLRPRREQSPHE